MRKYPIIDFLPNITSTEMSGAEALKFVPTTDSTSKIGWDYQSVVNGNEPNALLHSIYSFNAYEGATYDIFSVSYFDPFLLRIFDENGNVIEINSERNDPADYDLNGIRYGVDHLVDWVAPYSGTYYVAASWNQDETNSFFRLSVYEDMDTIFPEPILAKAGRIFNWAEDEYSLLFPDHPESEIISGFNARLYSNGNALAEKDENIYFYDINSDSVVLVGAVSDYISQAMSDGF